ADAKRDERARPATEILLSEWKIDIVGEANIIDPRDVLVPAQKLGDPSAVLDVALDAQGDRFDALQQQEGAYRRQDRTCGPLQHAAAAGNVGGLAEVVCVDEAMIGRVWTIEHREAVWISLPVEAAAVDNRTAERGAVSAQELSERVHDYVSAVLDRPE